jgi:hypothetical protein
MNPRRYGRLEIFGFFSQHPPVPRPRVLLIDAERQRQAELYPFDFRHKFIS